MPEVLRTGHVEHLTVGRRRPGHQLAGDLARGRHHGVEVGKYRVLVHLALPVPEQHRPVIRCHVRHLARVDDGVLGQSHHQQCQCCGCDRQPNRSPRQRATTDGCDGGADGSADHHDQRKPQTDLQLVAQAAQQQRDAEEAGSNDADLNPGQRPGSGAPHQAHRREDQQRTHRCPEHRRVQVILQRPVGADELEEDMEEVGTGGGDGEAQLSRRHAASPQGPCCDRPRDHERRRAEHVEVVEQPAPGR